ncbi:uncharacterized protein EV420DRAFT_1750078 [Desarmillaria tabescens]|uniref:Ras-binding domain-containing protein n=1 Tax=Armillaria tabescens TaxID=1929756 RepID=A0AA39JYJ4_ARMTA|nr:uncharacterized protein EV420DRAFT_1750078 [Desarmillaria tabescens]KAK0451300.1 hypothetical protein EV420DRAFT_1750078 [Desarmillaria tabescens]
MTSLRLLLWNFFLAARTVAITEQPSLGYTTPASVVPSRPFGYTWQPPPRVSSVAFHPPASGIIHFFAALSTPFDFHIRNPPFNGYLLGHRRARCVPIKGVDTSPTLTRSFCLPTVRIIVTSNAERYQVVEITGATNGSSIRERILSKLCIPDDRYSWFRVYQAQVGTYAIGSALSDAMLFEICLQQGDPSGSLAFFVSTAPDRPPKTAEPDYSDTYLYSQSAEIDSISDFSVGTSLSLLYITAPDTSLGFGKWGMVGSGSGVELVYHPRMPGSLDEPPSGKERCELTVNSCIIERHHQSDIISELYKGHMGEMPR